MHTRTLLLLVGLPLGLLAQTVTRYEQNDPRITYTGTWYPNSNTLESGGTALLANLKGSQAIVIFNGTGINWIGTTDYYSGICYVTIDGVPMTVNTANPAAATLYQQKLLSIHDLAPGLHHMTIEVIHSHDADTNASWIWIDAFEIENGSLVGGVMPAGTGMLQQTEVPVNYSGHWFQTAGAGYSGGNVNSAVDAGARVDVTFNGTSISWIGYRDEWSGLAQILVDGESRGTVDTYLSPSKSQATAYTVSGLSAGPHVLSIIATGTHSEQSQGSWIWVDGFQVGGSASVAPPSPTALTPTVSQASTETLTATFSSPAGYTSLDVVNILINNFLDGSHACYLAYSRASNTLYLLPDSGDATQITGKTLTGGGTLANSQCTVNLAGSSASGSGNNLTLMLNLQFSPSFGGNKVIYTAARDVGGANSGWRTMGTVGVPPLPSSFPNPVGMNPSSGSGASQTITFSFQDQNQATNLQTVWALVNTALDGRAACYIAYYRPGNLLYLVPDDGDGTKAQNMLLSGNNSLSNSQCTVSAQGAAVTTNGNTLTLTLPITFNAAFGGFKGVWMAASTLDGQTSAWQALGAEIIPGQ